MKQQSVTPPLDKNPPRMGRYAFPLRHLPGGHVLNVYVEVPTDFTQAEAGRVAGLVEALAAGLDAMGEKP